MKTIKNISEASDTVLVCRDLGHGWQFTTDTNITAGHNGTLLEFSRVMTCLRCGASKIQVIDGFTFGVKRVTMKYPESYLLAPHAPHITRADVRRVSINRLIMNRSN